MICVLPMSRPAANRRAMRNALVQFMLLVAALMACIDAPVMARDNAPASSIDAHHHGYVETSDDPVPGDNSSTGSGSEVLHHHCPAGLIANDALMPAMWSLPRDIFLSRAAAALASRAIAPPTEPPAA